MSTKVYTILGGKSPVNAGANYTANFSLNNNNRTCNIKSLFFDVRLYNANTFELYPVNRNNFIHLRLNVGTNALTKIGNVFENVTAGFTIMTGQGFSLYKPSFLLFDSFFIRNVLPCNVYVENHDAAINIGFEVTVVMEVEEIE